MLLNKDVNMIEIILLSLFKNLLKISLFKTHHQNEMMI